MASSRKRGPTFTVELPVKNLDRFTSYLNLPLRHRRQLEGATGPTARLECTIDEIESLATGFRIASEFGPKGYRDRIRAVHQQLDKILETYEQDREAALARPLVRTDEIFQFKISLLGTDPEIWRRVQVPDCALYDLHNIIQIAMGWEDAHLHQFTVDGIRYVVPDSEFELTDGDETRTLLSQIITPKRRKVRIDYQYDFGDSWDHEVVFECRVAREPKARYPRCTGGARNCPPEDSGGVWGFQNFLDALADPDSDSSAEALDFIGDDWDPSEFSVKAVNKYLPKLRLIEDGDEIEGPLG